MTEFEKASDQTRAQYYHDCDPGKKPYATVTVVSYDETIITCTLCGYSETHPSTEMP